MVSACSRSSTHMEQMSEWRPLSPRGCSRQAGPALSTPGRVFPRASLTTAEGAASTCATWRNNHVFKSCVLGALSANENLAWASSRPAVMWIRSPAQLVSVKEPIWLLLQETVVEMGFLKAAALVFENLY